MKKYLAIFLGVVFVLGFAASAFAIHAEIPAETQAVVAKGQTQITIGGDVRVRGELKKNTQDFNDDVKTTGSTAAGTEEGGSYDQRIRLSVEAKVTPSTMAYISIEGANGNTSTGWTWGEPGNGSKGIYQFGDAKRGTLDILEAWIQHKGSGLLGIPAGIKVGHMPLALGNRLFFDHTLFGDDALILFADPTKELHLALLTAKFSEDTNARADDANGYVALFAYNTKTFGISGDITYVDHQNAFPATTPPVAGQDAHLWNFGLRGNVDVAGLKLKGDLEVQSGKITDIPGEMKFRGWAAMVGASYKLEPVTLGIEYAYGSGDNDGDNKFETFVTSISNVQHYTYVYDYRVKTGAGILKGGIANTQYVKVDAAANLAKDLSGYVALYWLNAPKDVSLNGGPADDDLGWELDAKLTYKIDRNLTYWVEGGYFWPGDAYRFPTRDADNAYAVRHGVQLSF